MGDSMSTYLTPSYTFDEYNKALNHQLDEESEEVVLEDMKKVGESVATYVASKMSSIFDDMDKEERLAFWGNNEVSYGYDELSDLIMDYFQGCDL